GLGFIKWCTSGTFLIKIKPQFEVMPVELRLSTSLVLFPCRRLPSVLPKKALACGGGQAWAELVDDFRAGAQEVELLPFISFLGDRGITKSKLPSIQAVWHPQSQSYITCHTVLLHIAKSLPTDECEPGDAEHLRVQLISPGIDSIDAVGSITNDVALAMAESGLDGPVPAVELFTLDELNLPMEARLSFDSVVLQWRVAKVLGDDGMLAHRVQTMPDSLPAGAEGILQWADIQFGLLQEETRAQIQQKLSAIDQDSWVQVRLEARQPPQPEVQSTTITISHTSSSQRHLVDQDPRTAKSWGSGGRGTGNKFGPPLGCMYTDMVMLAREPMATASYADRHAHALGVVSAFTHEDDNTLGLMIKVYVEAGSLFEKALDAAGPVGGSQK
ncbi:hypothetical protein DUNSADRAFT_13925, partial [Dunaliella salina]